MGEQPSPGVFPYMINGFQTKDIQTIRGDFPALQRLVHQKPLVYLDNAATTLKPTPVVKAVSDHYLYGAANIHRGVHHLSEVATEQYEKTRVTVQEFINARDKKEIIFTSGTTGSINLVAHSFGSMLSPGDEVLITGMEHHSNIVPWQLLAARQGVVLKVVPITDDGEIQLETVATMITPKTKLVSLVAISNSLGTINPIEDVIRLAHQRGALVLIDGAQAVAHQAVDVHALGADFYAFSGHKLYGPTGVGVLYGRREILEKMPPFLSGGDMIRSVSFEGTTFAELPAKFEAGTPPIASVIGLGEAIRYVLGHGLKKIENYEQQLLAYGTEELKKVPSLRFIGTAACKAGILGFTLGDIHPHDIGTLVDREGVAIRVGHHCTQPVMKRFGVPATARASLAFYNQEADIDRLVKSLHHVLKVFS